MPDFTLNDLETIIQDRHQHPTEGSYTAKLFSAGTPKIAQKVGEEAVEVVIAALAQGRDDQLGELADLFYHTLVLMRALDISLEDVQGKLAERHQP